MDLVGTVSQQLVRTRWVRSRDINMLHVTMVTRDSVHVTVVTRGKHVGKCWGGGARDKCD